MKVSVIIPVYNAAPYLEQAVTSALDQPETGEVILIEDGSTDRSLAICEQLERQFHRVRLFLHPDNENRGPGASRNLGIRHATYEYVAFLDADDFYLPGRFRTASQIFAHHPLVEGVYEATGLHFESPASRKVWLNSPLHKGQAITTMKGRIPPKRLFHALASESGKGLFHTNAIVVRRALFEKTGLFDESLSLHQDMAMWIKMAAVGNLIGGRLHEPVAKRRVHDHNRILKLPKGASPYLKMMDHILSQWALQVGLPKKQLKLLAYKRWRNRLYGYDPWKRAEIESRTGGITARAWRRAAFLGKRLFHSPSLILSPHFFRFVFHGIRHLASRG